MAVLLASPALAQKRAAPRSAPAKPTAGGPGAELAVPFRPGESLTYDVSWSTYLSAGTATLKVLDKRPSFGSVAYYLVAEGRPSSLVGALYSLYYKADSLLDVYTLLPQRGSLYSEEGKRRRMKVTRFDHATRRGEYEIRTATLQKRSLTLEPQTQDILSSVYVLRAFNLRPNSRLTLPVTDGGVNYRVRMQVGQVESVKCGLGTVQAFRVTPTVLDAQGRSVGRPSTLWLSTDASHLPVRLEADLSVGSVVLTLQQVKR